MRPDLDNREWPLPLNLDPRYKGSPLMAQLYAGRWEGLVAEGYVVAKELAIRGSGRPIPAGECAITSLAAADQWVYGATSGRRAHVFAYCPLPAHEAVIDLWATEGPAAIRHALAWLPGHGVFAGTTLEEPGRGGEVYRVAEARCIGSMIQEWNPVKAEVASLGVPVDGEGVACLIGDAGRGRLYGLGDRSGTLFSVEAASGEVCTHGIVDELHRFSDDLILGPDGMVYACGTRGRIMRFDPEEGTIAETGMALPHMAGRAQYAQVGAWALDPRTGLIYAGDVADGLLSAIDVRAGRTRPLGAPTGRPHVRALVVAPDGRVYGVAGERDTIGHLFCYDPARAEMRDLGVLTAAVDRRWYGYEFDCAAAGQDGRLYFGESDRISHLFVYFPPGRVPEAGTGL